MNEMTLKEVREWHDEQANECRREDEKDAREFHQACAHALLEVERHR